MSYVGNKPAQKTIPVDDSVTTAMLQDDAVTSAKIDDLTIVNADINASAAIANSKMATDTTNATNLASGTVPTARLGSGSASSSTFLRGDQTYAALDTSGITDNKDDIALLGFKVAANGSLAKYDLVDQTIDAFEDASGVDESASSGETRNAANYFSVGGDVTGTQVAVTATGAGTWAAPGNLSGTIDLLVVAGGGGAGKSAWAPGAGGAGGLVYINNYAAVASTTYNLSVGAGGNGAEGSAVGSAGTDSVFDTSDSHETITSSGGGGGGYISSSPTAGGSGGGGGSSNNGSQGGASSDQVATFGSYTSVGFGNSGATGGTTDSGAAGGGGGAGAAGSGINGGAGKDYSSVFGTGVGESGWFAGGGGAGAWTGGGGAGAGSGGQGGGADGNTVSPGNDGTANTGGGGGGSKQDGNGGDGGSGVIIVKYDTAAPATMTLISNATTAVDGAPTTGDLVITYTDGAGTATVNTDIKAYISRNGSAYSSAVTLVSQGTTGGHTILTANGVDLSGITTGTSMRWKIETLNQSVSKETRIQAVSLGWS